MNFLQFRPQAKPVQSCVRVRLLATLSGSVVGSGRTSGQFFVRPDLWTQYSALAVAFKTGNNMNPSRAAFALPFGTVSGLWNIGSNGLSHANLYASGLLDSDENPFRDEPILPTGSDGEPETPIATPEPTSLLLLGAGLFGIRAWRRRLRPSANAPETA